jgi:hypothetical protein
MRVVSPFVWGAHEYTNLRLSKEHLYSTVMWITSRTNFRGAFALSAGTRMQRIRQNIAVLGGSFGLLLVLYLGAAQAHGPTLSLAGEKVRVG